MSSLEGKLREAADVYYIGVFTIVNWEISEKQALWLEISIIFS